MVRKRMRAAGTMTERTISSEEEILALCWKGKLIEGSVTENGRVLGVTQMEVDAAKAMVALLKKMLVLN